MTATISNRDILRQLKADLIGKDSHRGVTLTYSWLANQFGHFSLGFIPTLILYRVLLKYYQPYNASILSAIIISILWLLFEIYNFLGPLLSKQPSTFKALSISATNYKFEPAWKNIAFDTTTDLLFFWAGAFLSSVFCFYTSEALITLLVLTALIIFPAYYWYRTKMFLQIPQYPYQFRLSQWNFIISEEDKKAVHRFLANNSTGQHLLILGAKGSGKTSLSVGIATELSIKQRACVYTTAMKLYSNFFEPDGPKSPFWSWRSTSVLIIDDINPGEPVKDEIVSADTFLQLLDCYTTNQANREAIKKANVIWVLGDSKQIASAEKWKQMLIGIDVAGEKMSTINLSA
jgi:hypothetical protein